MALPSYEENKNLTHRSSDRKKLVKDGRSTMQNPKLTFPPEAHSDPSGDTVTQLR